MNKFTHKKTVIKESRFDFSKLEAGINIKGEAMLSVSLAVPKNPETNRMIVCTLEVTLGEDTDRIKLYVASQSTFSIDGEICQATLHRDAEEQCYPEAGRIMKERIAEITRLHVGTPLNIPIPTELSEY